MDSALKIADADSVAKAEEKPAPLKIRSKAEIDQYIANSPNKARYEEGIIPTIAEYVPEYASKLLDNTHNGFLIVDKNTMKLYRYDKYGVLQESVGIACSKFYGTKHKKADNRTPEGYFTIKGIFNSTDWLYTNDAGYTSPAKGQFGPRFMRLDTPVSQQIGIHGTAAPGSIGGRRSHGCIRMTNENIMRIHKLCESGMPVIVSPGPRDMAVNEREGYHVPSVPVTKGGVPCKAGSVSAYELSNPASKTPAKTQEVDVEATEDNVPDASEQPLQQESPAATEQQAAPSKVETPTPPAKEESEVPAQKSETITE
ncbi:MAG: L,D-transpeptidase family protein [Muribaculaceae bacterium]|nr:L,D-transpeptidase family protein [Muribaculaceae bacterium]